MIERKFPFYSRKYGQFFRDYQTFQKFDKYAIRKWIIEKHAEHKGKAYLPKQHRKGYTAW